MDERHIGLDSARPTLHMKAPEHHDTILTGETNRLGLEPVVLQDGGYIATPALESFDALINATSMRSVSMFSSKSGCRA